MVDKIEESAARSGNVKVFKWALRNDFYSDGNWNDCLYKEVAENGHIKVLELTDRKELSWYNRDILVGAAARNDWELLEFVLKKKPNQFDLSFTKTCANEGYIEVLEWWKEMELIELFIAAAYGGQWRVLEKLYENEYQQASSDFKEFLNKRIVNWAASGRQIDALEWARGIHGGAESCMFTAQYGHLHVLQ
jgi:hypothetical protein